MTEIYFELIRAPVELRWHANEPTDDAEVVSEQLARLRDYLEDLIGMITRDPEPPLLILASKVGDLTETVGRIRNDVATMLEHTPPAGGS